MPAAPILLPRLLSASAAARYLGIGETNLRGLPIRRRMLGARRLYDRNDLDAWADDLPIEGEAAGGESACDDAFGGRG